MFSSNISFLTALGAKHTKQSIVVSGGKKSLFPVNKLPRNDMCQAQKIRIRLVAGPCTDSIFHELHVCRVFRRVDMYFSVCSVLRTNLSNQEGSRKFQLKLTTHIHVLVNICNLGLISLSW